MKNFFKALFNIYHLVFGSRVASCRFTPTCSQYFLDATDKYGTIKGIYLAIKRVFSCHSLSTRPLYDPA